MFQLTAKTGLTKGAAWPISETPLVVGRDVLCDITINDPIVSRRHCEIRLIDETVWVEDLGSSNATFVNAKPVKTSPLQVGDEVAIGNAVFFVSALKGDEEARLAESGMRSATSAIRIGQLTFLNQTGESLFSKGRPRTAEDLSALFFMGRELSQATNRAQMVSILSQHLEERYTPDQLWIALYQGEEEPFLIYPLERSEALNSKASYRDLVARAIHERKGIHSPERWTQDGESGLCTTLVAPIVLGRESVGAIIVQINTPRGLYDENDLEFLLAMAHAVAPYLKAIERLEQLERENQRLVAGTPNAGPIVGSTRAIARVRELARNCARSDLNVLVLGDTGTGKELVARMIHDLSDRAAKPLTVVNCAAIPDDLFESEVFGHERGAFTGAHALKTGLFEESDGGTLFLDEVGDLSMHNQARLLRAIENGTFRRVGGMTDITVNVRVISATNKDLNEDIEAGRFRRDLFHRLNMFEIHIPSLRERRADIPGLAEHFFTQAQLRYQKTLDGFSAAALQALQDRLWPGNVRELRNVIERAVVMARHDRIQPEDLNLASQQKEKEAPFPTLQDLEKAHIIEAIRRTEGNVSAAAELLGIGRSTLYRKVAEYEISP